jgi:hypothetical protein
MASIKLAYRASSDLTVTNLHSIATSATWIGGWTSGTIDNTTDLDLDKLISAKITLGNATAGQIRVYVYAMLDDTNWPDVFSAGTEGTEGTCTIHDTEHLDASFRLMWAISTDTANGDIHNMPPTSVAALFGGVLPPKFAIYVTHSTAVNLAASGNQVTVKGVYATSA